MKQSLLYFSIVFFAIFVGSQITEGVLLVPYWKSLSANEFYAYYQQFGPLIGQYYTILTIIAALIPISISLYCKRAHPKALSSAVVSSIFAILFIVCFYVYFKGANELFYQAALSDIELRNELVSWTYWHWGRVILELVSLLFLVITVIRIQATHLSQN